MYKQELLKDFIKMADDITQMEHYQSYRERVRAFIENVYGSLELQKLDKLAKKDDRSGVHKVAGYLQGLLVLSDSTESKLPEILPTPAIRYDTTKVFIVHGHDSETKETVARFTQKIGLKPIILHEQPNSGLTIIEKLESFSNVGFAVILLTPDDIGGLATGKRNLQSRARQNVILELGYFIGKLSRNRVCALYKQGVEIPSDYGNVVGSGQVTSDRL